MSQQSKQQSSKKYNFISGLPRSGSTLLSSILNQNPRFSASISDCLHGYAHAIIRETEMSVGIGTLVSIDKRREIIQGIFDSYYSDKPEVCFNTNRAWTADTALLKELYPDFRMIVMVRDVRSVANSFEVLHQKNPFTIKPLYAHRDTSSVYERTAILMGQTDAPGYIKGPLDMLAASFASQFKDQIMYVTYGSLVKHPEQTMKAIYEFIGEEWFDHDFDDVAASYDEFDESAKIEGLHTIRKKVEYKPQKNLLPKDVWDSLKAYNVWETIDTSEYNWLQLR